MALRATFQAAQKEVDPFFCNGNPRRVAASRDTAGVDCGPTGATGATRAIFFRRPMPRKGLNACIHFFWTPFALGAAHLARRDPQRNGDCARFCPLSFLVRSSNSIITFIQLHVHSMPMCHQRDRTLLWKEAVMPSECAKQTMKSGTRSMRRKCNSDQTPCGVSIFSVCPSSFTRR